MPSHHNCLFKALFLVLVMQTFVDALFLEQLKGLDEVLKNHSVYANRLNELDQTLQASKILKDYMVEEFSSFTTDSVNFLLTHSGDDFLAKLIKETDSNFKTCEKLKQIHKKENFQIRFASEILQSDNYTGTDEKSNNFFYCVLLFKMNKMNIGREMLFWNDGNPLTKAKNAEKLYLFFGKSIQGFAELNGKAKVLHGNIRPESILIDYKSIQNKFELYMEPEIRDFDLMLENASGKNLYDRVVRYHPDYRCPEMKSKVKKDKTSKKEFFDDGFRCFEYSKDFIEDVYALGMTIKNVIDTNSPAIDTRFHGISYLQDLAQLMIDVRDKPKTSSIFASIFYKNDKVRPNMKQVLKSFLENIKSCEYCQFKSLREEFITSAEKSLESIPDLPILI